MKNLQSIPDNIYIDRPQALDELVTRLKRDYFVVLLGNSGSGKSKLVEKELLPKLDEGKTEGRAGEKWRVAFTTPSSDPIGNLAAALAKPGALYPDETTKPDFRNRIKTKLLTEPDALRQIYTDAAEESPFNLLIVVDQLNDLARFNKLLTNTGSGSSSSANQNQVSDDILFISLLLDVARSSIPVYLVLNCDNNYLGYFSRYQGLPEAMSAWRYTLSKITLADIKKVTEPLLQGLSGEESRLATLISKMTDDFKELSDQLDPYALLKFNLSWVLTIQKWKEAPNTDPLTIYNSIGSMKGGLQYFAEQEVYEKMNPDEQKRCTSILKGLTSKSSNEEYVSQPTPLDQLTTFCTRKDIGATSESDIRQIINRFNLHEEKFIQWTQANPQPIIDVNSGALLLNWERLGTWIDEETNHAQVYRSLVDKAFRLEDPKNVQEEAFQSIGLLKQIGDGYKKLGLAYSRWKSGSDVVSEKINTGLSDGSELVSAIQWEIDCQPTEQWATRYPTKLPKLNEAETKNILSAFSKQTVDQLNHFQVALRFLEKSKLRRDAELEEKQRQLETAKSRQRIATILSVISVIVSIAAIYFWHLAKEEKRNIEMIQFVRVLEENDVLNLPRAIKSDTILSLSKAIHDKTNIDNNEEVLNLLVEKKVLKIDPENDTLKRIDFDALILLGDFLKIKDTLDKRYSGPMVEKLMKLHERHHQYVASPRNNKRFLQNPPLFNTMYAYVDAEKSPGLFKSAIDTSRLNTLIQQHCMVNVPGQPNYYVFGDQFGRVWLQDLRNRAAIWKDTLKETVTCVSFSSNGDNMYVGTVSGRVYRYATNKFINTAPAVHEMLFKSEAGPIYFIKERFPSKALLVRTAGQIFFTDDKGKRLSEILNVPLPYIASTTCDAADNWMIATGYGTSFLYQLDFNNKKCVQRARFAHPSRTVLGTALRSDYSGKEPFMWLAMGSIGGSVWAGKLYLSNLNANPNMSIDVDYLDDPTFKHTAWHREGPVSGLAFNPGFPQLACSSLEGAIELRNLDSPEFLAALGANEKSLDSGESYQTLKSLDKDNDDISVDNRVQGISGIAYVDANNLAIYQNSTSWVMKTNIDALWEFLYCLYQDCK